MNGFISFFLLVGSVFAGDIKEHSKEIKKYNGEVSRYEYRMTELKEQKKQIKGGDYLDEVLGEIANIHRDLLSIRKKRRDLKVHLKKEHPESDLFYDVSLHKKYEKRRKKGGDPVEKDLDVLLLLVQSQYAKYINSNLAAKNKLDALNKEVKAAKKKAKAKVRKEFRKKRLKNELEIN